MNVYIYQADLYCEECGEDIKRRMRRWENPPGARSEETFDSDEMPKGPNGSGGGESDSPCHCASREDCLNAITLSDGTKIGCWLENDLTQEGVRSLQESIRERPDNEVIQLWQEWYSEELAWA